MKYIAPEMEMMTIDTEDIILASNQGGNGGNGGGLGDNGDYEMGDDEL